MNGIAVLRNSLMVLPCLLLWLPCLAVAEESPGITVSETGVVSAMPDVVELTASVVGNAELAGDAVAKFRGNRQRLIDALNGLGIKGLVIAGSGLAINSGTPVNVMAGLQGQPQPPAADKLAVQEQVTVTLSGVDAMKPEELLQTITRIIDAAKDAGVTMGASTPKSMIEIQLRGSKPAALATFKLSKPDELRQKAYAAALEQARAKAQRLAGLAGLKLGEIVSIRETAAAGQDDKSGMGAYFAMFGMGASSAPDYSAPEMRSIPVSVSLNVQFGIGK
jgi:uncharacterized protein YggE